MIAKRAYGVTNSEVSVVFFGIGMLVVGFAIYYCLHLRHLISMVPNTEGLTNTLTLVVSLLFIGIIFKLIAVVIPNYMISKWDLNPLVDKQTNKNFINWLRFTRNRTFRIHTVKMGTHGQTKGVVGGKKADVIDMGDYTLNAENGNKFLCVYDFLSQNENLEECVGWNLINKHYAGLIGFKAYEKAVDLKQTFNDIDIKPVKDGDIPVS